MRKFTMSHELMKDGKAVTVDVLWNMTVGELVGMIAEREGLVKLLTRLPATVACRNYAIINTAMGGMALGEHEDFFNRHYGRDADCGACSLGDDIKTEHHCDECPVRLEFHAQAERSEAALGLKSNVIDAPQEQIERVAQ